LGAFKEGQVKTRKDAICLIQRKRKEGVMTHSQHSEVEEPCSLFEGEKRVGRRMTKKCGWVG